MDYMFKYSDYAPECFKYKDYYRLSDALESISKSDGDRRRINSILTEGGYDDYSVNTVSSYMNHRNPEIEARKRVGMAYLIANNPETFETIKQNEICFFHGTNSLALPSILTHGLRSFGYLEKNNIEIKSGETSTMEYRRGEKSTDFVSMTDDFETVLDYSMSSDTSKRNSPFGVIIGIKKDALKQLKRVPINSDVIEMGIKDGIPANLISFIGVPEDKIKFVSKLVGDKEISVMPAPLDFRKKFYMIDTDGIISFDEKKFNDVQNGLKSKVASFDIENYKKLAEKITPKRMFETLTKLLNGRKEKSNLNRGGMEIGE